MHIDERLICSPYSPYVACLREATYYDDKYDNRNGSLFLPSRLCVSGCYICVAALVCVRVPVISVSRALATHVYVWLSQFVFETIRAQYLSSPLLLQRH